MTDQPGKPKRTIRWLFGTAGPDQAIHQTSGLIAIVCMTIIGLTGWQIQSEYFDQLQRHDQDVANLSTVLLRNAESSILHSSTILLGLVERLEKDKLTPDELRRLKSVARAQASSYPEIQGIFVYDAKGNQIFSSLELPTGGNFFERNYFQHHLNDPSPDIYLAPPIRSRTSGDWVFTVSQRMSDSQGRFLGITMVTLKVQTFLSFYRNLNLDENALVSLIRKDGTTLLRMPFKESEIGTSVIGGAAYNAIQQGETEGVTTYSSPIDRIRRIVGFSASKTLPFYIVVGLEECRAFREWRTSAYISSAVALGPLILIVALGLKTIAGIRKRHETEDRLRQAHLTLTEMNRSLEVLASEDALTGLANRRQMERVLSQYFLPPNPDRTLLSFILIDIDHFKNYNDTYGHQAGDQCLREVSGHIQNQLHRHTDIPVRYGGEELAVILPDTGEAGAVKVAEKIRAAVFEAAIENNNTPLGRLTLSLGVSTCIPNHDGAAQDLIAQADKALYQAKHEGRNRVVFKAGLGQ
ncbi:sensor domain-containing diguanylate cyclase [Azomonas macrocytogenes]|uniref:diguanylate cyclase n=1 Tax=Azomonas macrocytogenes TaxID=69962 RepID=A0A839T0E0_AZOMA|nr:sensor domain-containing diguanylate cyclase [Azomonas macrocytogenes]MBB3102598.1 diguanylate cyclase (GGDEF)-like protein [Azomonas macrocytogenes]